MSVKALDFPVMTGIEFAKGHGTGNDFIVIPDLNDDLDLHPRLIQALCDRHRGIGGDGVLRVVRSVDHGYFMDYRNADGSVAEMCGNGARVFARYLVDKSYHSAGEFSFDTRSGLIWANCPGDGDVSITMGRASDRGIQAPTDVTFGERSWSGMAVWAPNPHAVVMVTELDELDEVSGAPLVDPTIFPEGVNVEFVQSIAPGHVSIRIIERGVGETLSCGTGACAVAWALPRMLDTSASRREHEVGPVRVDVPGGTVWVHESSDGELTLTGPAVLVAEGHVDPIWWSQQ